LSITVKSVSLALIQDRKVIGMAKKVALLHTSLVFINRERLIFDIIAELMPDVELVNIIEDGMLKDVITTGSISPHVTRRMCLYVLAAEAMGVDAIFNTCSSLGPTMDVARQLISTPIVKIDDGMAEVAAKEGKRIAVLATVPTTLPPTVALIQEKAASFKKDIETRPALSKGAFELLMNNQVESHDDMVAKTALEMASWADTIVLAQCSMARLAPRLQEEVKRPVLASPRLGVERLKSVLENL
jgi:Asp/Glu/hydantoin racemase